MIPTTGVPAIAVEDRGGAGGRTRPVWHRWFAAGLIAIAANLALGVNAEAKTVSTSLSAGRSVTVRVSQPLRRQGVWVLRMRVSSDGEKKFRVRARRAGAASFTVLTTGTKNGLASCDAGAGSIFCENITVPAVPAPGSWTFTVKNTGTHRFNVSMTVTWRAIARAG